MNSEKYQIGEITLQLELPAGDFCYVFDGNSSTGKTYLYDLFKTAMTLSSMEHDFLAFTYDPVMQKKFYIEALQDFNGKYIMLDRFDMYFDIDIAEAAIKDGRVVLMDLKDYCAMQKLPVHGAEISFDATSLEVKHI